MKRKHLLGNRIFMALVFVFLYAPIFILIIFSFNAGNSSAEHLLEQIPGTSCYVFLNPKTGAPYRLHEFYYLHKRILKQAGLPWVAFRNLQRQCMEVEI